MAISVFDLFSIGIGPSSSHTVGPMRAALLFINGLKSQQLILETKSVQIQLFGSLGATGKGHGSDKAVILGLLGESPESVDIDSIKTRLDEIGKENKLALLGDYPIVFNRKSDLIFHRRKSLPYHPNGIIFISKNAEGDIICEKTYYSVGGGFVVDDNAIKKDRIKNDETVLPYGFGSGDELLSLCEKNKMSISQIMLKNELVWHSEKEIRGKLLEIWQAMSSCIVKGCYTEGILPGGLQVKRRAPMLYQKLKKEESEGLLDGLAIMDWVNLFALAVNEENAAGGRVVTAPTNGAAGIIPAVLNYFISFCDGCDDDIINFLLTAGAIGILFKENASISGAEVGCQGEVGSACAMAAGGLAEVLKGSPAQVENAAEIGMEHNLGLTCDPIGALVQIPCIERNAMASIKAINAARLALKGDGLHIVSLDNVIKTMRDTGRDMKDKYKETSRGGLAVNVIEC